MNLKQLFVAVPAALFVIGNGVAIAGQTVGVAGTIACVTDKRDEKEPEQGTQARRRCAAMRRHPRRCRLTEVRSRLRRQVRVHARTRAGRAPGPALATLKGGTGYTIPGRKVRTSKNTRTNIPVALKVRGASGGGTYMYESLTDTLTGGTYKGQLVLP